MSLVDRYTFGSGEQMVLRMPDCTAKRVSNAMSAPMSPTNVTEALTFFDAHNLPKTPVRHGDKKGRLKGWSQPGHNADASVFRLDDNIGVLNGAQPTAGWYFHDVDLDANSDAARAIARRLLPSTGWRYGRPSKPESHYNYFTTRPLRTRKYLSVDGKVIVELRGVTKKKTHTLSVAPGSTHSSGEAIRFCEPRGDVGRVEDPDALDCAVQHTAIAILIRDVWPGVGSRHRLRLAFAKVLLEHEVSLHQAIATLEAVMEATGSDVTDVKPAVRSTEEALRLGSPTEGALAIREVLGNDLGQKVLIQIARFLRSSAIDSSTGVVMEGGKLVQIVDCAELALINGDSPIYQRGGLLIRPIKLAQLGDTSVVDEVHREAGATVLLAVREPWLTEQMSRTLKWYSRRGEELVPADPRSIYSRTLLNRCEWRFSVLRAVLTAPTLDRDGRIIEEPGFDAASGLLLDIEQGSYPPVPTAPTKQDAEVALECLEKPLRGFPFVSDEARAVALSAMLTALIRLALRSAPLHGFDAPTAGTGKSLLAELVGLLATGVRPPAMSQGKSEEEDEKRLSTVLFAGDPVIHIDNCERALAGDFLCSMLTQEVVQARILGYSERRVLPSTALVLASGNNLTCVGDVSRRAVFCRLDAEVERPDTREFDFDCHKEVLARRPELIIAGLTVLRAFIHAGSPGRVKPMGSFDDWAWVRGALVWLDCADPAETRQATVESDPRKADLFAVMQLWDAAFGNDRTNVSTIGSENRFPVIELRNKLVDVACRRGTWSGKSVGWWLRRNKDQIVGGQCFQCEPGADGLSWWLHTAVPHPM